MANKHRHRSGPTNLVMGGAVASATVIEIGDVVYQQSGGVLPADTAALWDTNLATTQEAAHDLFLGVSQDQSRNGDTADIRVNTTGRHAFACASATFTMGDLVGMAKAAGNNLEAQTVVAVADADLAIGQVSQNYTSAVTEVEVDILSTIVYGGPQEIA